MLDVVAGYNRADPGSVRAPRRRYADSLGHALPRLKVGVVQPEADDGVLPDVRGSLETTAELLRGRSRDAGGGLPHPDQAQRALFAILYPEAATYHRHWLATCPDAYSPTRACPTHHQRRLTGLVAGCRRVATTAGALRFPSPGPTTG